MLLGVLGGCSDYTNLSADDFEALLGEDSAFLLDVRRPDEFDEGHIAGAANADFLGPDFLEQVEKLCPKDKPLAIYCRSGRRSANAAAALVKAGYKVNNLIGGIQAWQDAGKSVETDPDLQYAGTLLPAGTEAPEFTLTDVDGNIHHMSDYLGKTVLLTFWASWCPDCRAELPFLRELYGSVDRSKVEFVSISFDKTLRALHEFSAENPLPGVQLFDPAGKKDSAVAGAYGIKWIPSLYVIGPDGKVMRSTVVAQRAAALLK